MSVSQVPWKEIGKVILELYEVYHIKNSLSVQERYEQQIKYFEQLLGMVRNVDANLIKEYIDARAPINAILAGIQAKVKKELEELLEVKGVDLKITPASSFTAGTNLMHESDIDFNVPVKNLNTETLVLLANLCGTKGYRFTGALSTDNPGIYYVFYQVIQEGEIKIEIEVKIRHAEVYEKIHSKMHEYLDNEMTAEDKATVTWIKHNLSKEKKYYKAFKALYYEYALAKAGVYEMIYPLTGGGRTRRKHKSVSKSRDNAQLFVRKR